MTSTLSFDGPAAAVVFDMCSWATNRGQVVRGTMPRRESRGRCPDAGGAALEAGGTPVCGVGRLVVGRVGRWGVASVAACVGNSASRGALAQLRSATAARGGNVHTTRRRSGRGVGGCVAGSVWLPSAGSRSGPPASPPSRFAVQTRSGAHGRALAATHPVLAPNSWPSTAGTRPVIPG